MRDNRPQALRERETTGYESFERKRDNRLQSLREREREQVTISAREKETTGYKPFKKERASTCIPAPCCSRPAVSPTRIVALAGVMFQAKSPNAFNMSPSRAADDHGASSPCFDISGPVKVVIYVYYDAEFT